MTKEQLEYLLAYIDVCVQAATLRSEHLPYYKENEKATRLRKALLKTVESSSLIFPPQPMKDTYDD